MVFGLLFNKFNDMIFCYIVTINLWPWILFLIVFLNIFNFEFSFFNIGHILQSPSANVLPTLPFHVLRSLFSTTPLTTDDGVLLRRMALEIGALHLILVCLSALSHHAPRVPNSSLNQAEVGWVLLTSIVRKLS